MKPPLDLTRVKVFPLAQRRSEAQIDEIIISADTPAPAIDDFNLGFIRQAEKPG